MLIAAFPALRTYLARLGSRQIRTMGTIGGNIGTASPIGDMPPVLLALETTAHARLARGARELPLEDFFLGYRKTALAPDEVIQSLTLPRCGRARCFFCDKVSKRRDQDISTVAGAYRLRIKNGKIEDARLGLRRHGGDAQAREPCRGGAAEGRRFGATCERRRCRRPGLPADRRLARHRRLSPAGRRQPAAPPRAGASPSRSAPVEVEAL